jgi:hypothetical protein
LARLINHFNAKSSFAYCCHSVCNNNNKSFSFSQNYHISGFHFILKEKGTIWSKKILIKKNVLSSSLSPSLSLPLSPSLSLSLPLSPSLPHLQRKLSSLPSQFILGMVRSDQVRSLFVSVFVFLSLFVSLYPSKNIFILKEHNFQITTRCLKKVELKISHLKKTKMY